MVRRSTIVHYSGAKEQYRFLVELRQSVDHTDGEYEETIIIWRIVGKEFKLSLAKIFEKVIKIGKPGRGIFRPLLMKGQKGRKAKDQQPQQ